MWSEVILRVGWESTDGACKCAMRDDLGIGGHPETPVEVIGDEIPEMFEALELTGIE